MKIGIFYDLGSTYSFKIFIFIIILINKKKNNKFNMNNY